MGEVWRLTVRLAVRLAVRLGGGGVETELPWMDSDTPWVGLWCAYGDRVGEEWGIV